MMCRVLLLLLAAVPLYGKSLHWRAVDVDARLDRDGNLHVVERQQMVFDGDWNGGERNFNLRPGQDVTVTRIVRIDGDREIALAPGSLEDVDRYAFADRNIVRWRSRLPSDPPFDNRELTYVLEYTYSNLLVPVDGRFHLAHDFGLPDRSGVIERFQLNVDFDPVWNMKNVRETRMPLQPGESVLVAADLLYGGEGSPAGAVRLLPWWAGPAALAFFAIGAALLIVGFLKAEREVGRFTPLRAEFDPALLKLKPELAGAVWDAGVGPAEVAALLARMSQEGTITTRVEGDVLHLKLNVERNTLSGYESMLVRKLFITDETDTQKIKKHYKGVGFDPAGEITPGIESALVQAIPRWTAKTRRFNPWLHVPILLVTGLLVIGTALRDDLIGIALTALCVGGIFGLIATVMAYQKSRAIAAFRRAFFTPAMLIAIPAAGFAFGALQAAGSFLGVPVLFAIAAWLLALLHLVLNVLKIRDPREVIAYRRRIAGARRFFIEQLQLPQPALRDEWFPYLLAFGLGKQADRWFRAFGGGTSQDWSGSAISSSSSASSSSWTGGGGAFGGAGATASWAVAASSIAAGVGASSSSGGGGGGGGSSSGGGGGGGW